MHVTQVSNHMLIDYSLKEEYLLHRVGCLLPDQTVDLGITKQHKAFHFADIFHNLILLEQVISHTLLYHVSAGHVASDSSLQHHSVGFDRVENLAEPAHSEVGLYTRGDLVDIVNPTANNQALETLLNLLGGHVQAQILFLSDGLLHDVEAALLISRHIATQGPLNVPRGPLIHSLLGQLERIVHYSFLQSHAEEELANAIDIGSVVRVLDYSFAGIETVVELVTEFMPHEYI